MSPSEARERLRLYRRASRALGAFYARFSGRFCAECLEVTRRQHRSDPRADVELLEGTFPGCCQAGVADALWIPRRPDGGRFPRELARAMTEERGEVAAPAAEPPAYRVRETRTGLVAEGFGCIYLGEGGCRLGELKAPLCIAYACEAVRDAVAAVLGPEWVGGDNDDFCGCLGALTACVHGDLEEAEAEILRLEERLASGTVALERWERESGETLFELHGSSGCPSSPS